MERDPKSWDITLETEGGEFIASPNINIREFLAALDKWSTKEFLLRTHCLQFIDEWGDTIFNRLQKPALIDELCSVVDNSGSAEAREFFEPLITFLSVNDGPHAYVKFYGD